MTTPKPEASTLEVRKGITRKKVEERKPDEEGFYTYEMGISIACCSETQCHFFENDEERNAFAEESIGQLKEYVELASMSDGIDPESIKLSKRPISMGEEEVENPTHGVSGEDGKIDNRRFIEQPIILCSITWKSEDEDELHEVQEMETCLAATIGIRSEHYENCYQFGSEHRQTGNEAHGVG